MMRRCFFGPFPFSEFSANQRGQQSHLIFNLRTFNLNLHRNVMKFVLHTYITVLVALLPRTRTYQ